jgi:peptidoglycan L-alanyl-D-glutamate endopeptidase CwlK
MKDQKTIDRINLLHPSIRKEVLDLYENKIVPALTGRAICRFAFTLRTFSEQDVLYAQGRTKLFDAAGNRLGVVTKAKGGQSIHNYGLAIDIVLIVEGNSASWDTVKDFDKDGKSDWMEVVSIFKAAGWSWGGDWKFKDMPHFEKKGYDWKTLFEKHNRKDFIQGTTYVNL